MGIPFGLPFIPVSSDEVKECVVSMLETWRSYILTLNQYSEHTQNNLISFLNYIEKNYIGDRAKFRPEYWADSNFVATRNLGRESTNNVSFGSSSILNMKRLFSEV